VKARSRSDGRTPRSARRAPAGRSLLPPLACSSCGRTYPPLAPAWRCECGGPLDLGIASAFDPDAVAGEGVWRYRAALPPFDDAHIVSLGEGATPLVQARPGGSLWYKLDFLFPTGSFKDRGSTVLVSYLKEMGASRVVVDSSGNAGASMAAYCSAAGITCEIYIPAATSPTKTRQIRSYGAQIVLVEGTRADASRAAEAAAGGEAVYASHLWSPYFLAGTQTFAFEIWEQLGRRAPDALVLPVGAGTLLLGAYQGFRRLMDAGIVPALPRLYGVQAEHCAPLHQAMRRGRDSADDLEVAVRETMAEGIRVLRPPRSRQILRAVRESGGDIVAVAEREIHQGWFQAAHRGLFIEPTAAAAVAGAARLAEQGAVHEDEIVVAALTGTGLKAAETLADGQAAGDQGRG
jgi:threonine synthase